MTTIPEFTQAVETAVRAADGDSNDAEIEALQDAVELACRLLDVDLDAIRNAVEATE